MLYHPRVNPYTQPTKMFRFRKIKPAAQVTSVIMLTEGGSHAWCESNYGIIRKEWKNIPSDMRGEYIDRLREAVELSDKLFHDAIMKAAEEYKRIWAANSAPEGCDEY